MRSAYRSSLELARKTGCRSLAFPLISSGIYGYPKAEALRVAVETIGEFLMEPETELEVYLTVFDRDSVSLGEAVDADLRHYIDSYYEETPFYRWREGRMAGKPELLSAEESEPVFSPPASQEIAPQRVPSQLREETCAPEPPYGPTSPDMPAPASLPVSADQPVSACLLTSVNMPPASGQMADMSGNRSLEELLNRMDETFSQMLLRLIDEKGFTDVEVYKRANMDRKLFSKIRKQKEYHPRKQTVLALSIALRLSVDETIDLLMRAGYTFSNSQKADVIIRYFLEKEEYDIFLINEALFCYEQPLLGA